MAEAFGAPFDGACSSAANPPLMIDHVGLGAAKTELTYLNLKYNKYICEIK